MSGQHLDPGWRLPFAQTFDDRPAPRWVSPYSIDPVVVHGFDLTGAMVYLANPDTGWDAISEPSEIDPVLSIFGESDSRPTYFSRTYRDLAPDQRHDYLAWLASGRRAPNADRSFVRLFLHGLERRVILDFDHDPQVTMELPAIAAELQALRDVYADRVFPGFADSLLGIIAMLRLSEEDDLPVPAIDPASWEEPPLLRFGLGRFVAQKRPIPADWAAVWSWYRRDIVIRSALHRTAKEYAAVFAHHYTEVHGAGLTFRAGSRKVAIEFYAANPTVGSVRITLSAIPDVFSRPTAGQNLRALAEQVWADLGPYARAVNRSFTTDESLSLAALLPPILQSREVPAIGEALRTLDLTLGSCTATTILEADLVELWWPPTWDGSPPTQQLAAKDRKALTALIGRFGYGAEPDPRYGKRPWHRAAGDGLTVFRTGEAVPAAPSPGWNAAVFAAQAGAAIIAQEGALDETTAAHLAAEVADAYALHPTEAVRIQVALDAIAASDEPVKITGLKTFIDPLSEPERERIADFANGVAARHGAVSPSIVTLLQKITRMMGLDPKSASSRLFGAMTRGGLAPRTSAPSSSRRLTLDHNAIAATTAATEAVSDLLGGLLAEGDEPIARPAASPVADSSPGVTGLDAAHAAMVQTLAKSGATTWTEPALDALAQEHHLLGAGAIDTLNDAALDIADELLLIDEGDGFTLDRAVLAAMLGISIPATGNDEGGS